MERRVVITSTGTLNPLGLTSEESWKRALAGESGIQKITRFDASEFACQIAGEIKGFNPDDTIPPKEQKKMARFVQLAVAAGTECFKQSGLNESNFNPERFGTFVGVGMGGLPEIEHWHDVKNAKGPRRISPFFIPMVIPNLAAGQLSIIYNAKGPNNCTATACSSSAHAIGEAFRYIQTGKADLMMAGGAESVVCAMGVGGFAAMKALSTRNDEPTKASRPFDKDRDGFVMGEGSAILMLEELEHAQKRGAKILGEVVGYALNADAHHLTSPAPEHEGGYRCMKLALDDAGLKPSDIDYINTHGTSTPVGDVLECQAVQNLFTETLDQLNISSTKSMTGHLLGAAGALEGMFSVLALRDQVIPPTINVEYLDPDIKVNVTPNKAQEKKMTYALSNSFGFGGTNASLIFKKFDS